MVTPNLPLAGTCRCGRVEIEVTAPPIMTSACHCRGCQRMSASAFSLTAIIPAEGFRVIRGEPVLGGLRGATRHYFCPDCLTWMFTRPDGFDQIVNLRPTMLDDASWIVPYIESYVSEKLPGVVSGAKHSFDKFPEPHQYPELMAGFAKDGAKP